MIYKHPAPHEPIRQGDIFRNIPLIEYDPADMLVFASEGIENKGVQSAVNWIDNTQNQDLQILARVKTCDGIVVTQDCDTQRDDYIALFEIAEFFSVTRLDIGKKDPIQWWAEKFPPMTHEARAAKWFYLPASPEIGFTTKMVANFQTIITVPLKFLDKHKERFRAGRLNDEADEHFREHVSNYFRRYAYDEWYPLTKEEFEVYRKLRDKENSEPRDHQK